MFVFHLSSSSVAVLAQLPPPAPWTVLLANAGLRQKFRGSKTVPCDNESQCNPGGLIASNAIAVALLRFGDFVDLLILYPHAGGRSIDEGLVTAIKSAID